MSRCDICETEKDLVAHDFQPAYDEDEHFLRCWCGFIKPKSYGTHEYTSYVAYGSSHIVACECGYHDALATPEAHTYDIIEFDDDTHHYRCECGAKLEDSVQAHKYIYKSKDKNTHTLTCETCAIESSENHTFDQKNNSECVCGTKKPANSTKDEHTHTLEMKSDKISHWEACECGYVGEKADHTMKDGACTVCSYKSNATESNKNTATDVESDNDEDTSADERTGCGSSLGEFAIVGAVLVIGTGLVFKKREDI